MRHNFPFIAAALLAILAACGGQAGGLGASGRGDPAPLVYAPPGTAFRLANMVNGEPSESLIHAGRADGPRGGFVKADGATGGFYPACWGCGGEMRIEEDKYALLWPLKTGKHVRFLRTSPTGGVAVVSIRVAGAETIETAAGRFETYRLETAIEARTGPRWRARLTAWWAPDPGWVVRAEGIDSDGNRLVSEVASITSP